MNRGQNKNNTVKLLLSGHVWDVPKCLVNRGCPLNRGCKTCTMFVMLNKGIRLIGGALTVFIRMSAQPRISAHLE